MIGPRIEATPPGIARSAGSRLMFIDALRGFAIGLVVLGHSLQYGLATADDNVLFRLIYSFHMPLFMFISGFVYSGDRRDASSELLQKSRALLVPFLAWLPVTWLWMQFGAEHLSVSAFLSRVVASPDAGGLWFLWVLFLINVVVLAGRHFAPARSKTATWGLWFLLNLVVLARPSSNMLGIKLLCWHLPFFMVGTAFRSRHSAAPLRWPPTIACLLVYALLFLGWARVGGGPIASLLGGLNGAPAVLALRAYSYATAFFAIFAAFGLFSRIPENASVRPFLFLGGISLEIYATHIYFVGFAVSMTAPLTWPDAARVAAIFAIGLAGAFAAISLIRRAPPLAALMFGIRGASAPSRNHAQPHTEA